MGTQEPVPKPTTMCALLDVWALSGIYHCQRALSQGSDMATFASQMDPEAAVCRVVEG